jgi:predicted nucleic acid-binding protein
MTRTGYLIDTWAWIEYFDHSCKEVVEIFDEGELIHTSIISLTEVMTSFARRENAAGGHAATGKIMRISQILPITSTIAIGAGLYTRKEFPGGIANRIIYATAEAHRLTICTGDKDFKNVPGVLYLGE